MASRCKKNGVTWIFSVPLEQRRTENCGQQLLGAALNANGLQPTDYQQSTTSSPVNTYTVNRNQKMSTIVELLSND